MGAYLGFGFAPGFFISSKSCVLGVREAEKVNATLLGRRAVE
jgi:hypothetical protein